MWVQRLRSAVQISALMWVVSLCAPAASAQELLYPRIDNKLGGYNLGHRLRAVGDVNDDGYEDFLADGYGLAYLISSVDGDRIGIFNHLDNTNFGVNLTSGDINGDGVLDVLIGHANNEDKLYIYEGPNWNTPIAMDGPVESNDFGFSIATLGDLNQDGAEEFAVGSPRSARVDVYDGLSRSWRFAISDGSIGTENGFGWDCNSDIDFDGDGKPELVVSNHAAGVVTIYKVTDTSATVLATLAPGLSYFGIDLASAGDVNTDGVDDLLVGEWGYPGFQNAHLYSGSDFSLLEIIEPSPGGCFGWGMDGGHDLDGDGVPDIVLGSNCVSNRDGWVAAYSGINLQAGSELFSIAGSPQLAEDFGSGVQFLQAPGGRSLLAVGVRRAGSGSAGAVEVYCLPEPTPVITSVSPGLPDCSPEVTIQGSRFREDCKVTIGGFTAAVIDVSDTEIRVLAPVLSQGSWDVTVCNLSFLPSCDRCSTLVDGYVAEAPRIDSIFPASGQAGHPTTVTITGDHFVPPVTVRFDGLDGTVLQETPTWIEVTAPSQSHGCVDVVVVSSDGGSGCSTESSPLVDGFCYRNPPTLDRVTPKRGSLCASTTVTLFGSDFTDVSAVTFGGLPVDEMTFVSDQRLEVVVPSQAAAFVDVEVSTGVGAPATLLGAFEFRSLPPRLEGISPEQGSFVGNMPVTLSGARFCDSGGPNELRVYFGNQLATNVQRIDAWTIIAMTPSYTPKNGQEEEAVSVRVVHPDEASSILVDAFTYEPGNVFEVGTGHPYLTIQSAIDDPLVTDGSLIKVYAKTGSAYDEKLDTKGKAILILGVLHPTFDTQPRIVAPPGFRCLTIQSGEGPGTVIANLNFAGSLGGGGILVQNGSSPLILHNLIDDTRTSADGGGILVRSGSSPLILENLLVNNVARHGGGIAVLDLGSAPRIINNEIRNNQATGDGGGIYLGNGSSADLVSGDKRVDDWLPSLPLIGGLFGNHAEGRGGGIFCGSSPTIEGVRLRRRLVHNAIVGNDAIQMGGGVFVEGGSNVLIANSSITDNNPEHFDQGHSHGSGGGIACDGTTASTTSIAISTNRIERNRADGPCAMGGGIFLGGTQGSEIYPAITGNLIFENASQVGGGIALHVKIQQAIIQHNVLASNSAQLLCTDPNVCPDESGLLCPWQQPGAQTPDVLAPGLLARDSAIPVFVSNTIQGNWGGNTQANGGGLHLIDGLLSGLSVRDCILHGNDNYQIWYGGNSINVSYSNLAPNPWGGSTGSANDLGGNQFGPDPLFNNPSLFDFSLQSISPCIDAGDPSFPPPVGGGDRKDIGAIEFRQEPGGGANGGGPGGGKRK